MLDSLVRVSRRVGSVRRNGTILGARRSRGTRGAPVLGSPRLGARPAAAASEDGGAPGGGARAHRACQWGREAPKARAALIRLLPTISRTISLSFQSPFHLSLTVLVRYRSLANIQLSMDITTVLALQSQATRLTGGRPGLGRFGRDGALTLSGSLSQQRIAPDARGAAYPGYNAAAKRGRSFSN